MESKPDLDPNIENHGVQAWAGTSIASGDASMTILTRSMAGKPNIGLPSELILPRELKAAFILRAASREGEKMRLCILRVLPPCEYMLLTSAESMKCVACPSFFFLSTKSPFPVGSSCSSIEAKWAGWVKSPVPIRPIPFNLAQSASVSSVICLLVALEYPLCMCRSAIMRIKIQVKQ